MQDTKTVVEAAKKLIGEGNSKEALKLLKPFKKNLKSNDLELIQVFADAYLDESNVEKAYPLLTRCCEMDPQGLKGGSEKFFTLGQITGGQDGVNILFQGITNVSQEAGDVITKEQTDKIVKGLLSMIEIWMTDLCMEPNAEMQCEELIQKALEISDNKSPEALSMLGSIRISQQRFPEASNAFLEAWKNFELKKQDIEENLQEASLSSHKEYIELLQPLLSLVKMCIEMGLYEVSLKIISAIKDIEEDNLENYYLEGFCYYLLCKLEMFKSHNPEVAITAENIYEFNEHFEEVVIDLTYPALTDFIHEARIAFSFAAKSGESCDPDDEIAQELYSGSLRLLEILGGPIDDSELLRLKKGENVEEADLQIEIEEDTNE
ncbi:hypothetical protein Kpol_1036p81 [Vanderwaltozyma polyspora DSM 70294]|uniref:Uncharacterized protein n=1 Tax=Vanderwaltozyma polyspora (strain ATCC 22028 / DSM 70294 / BCRC 21397 / CBS 2163 / NBRC 10782 / NRRL Y-8283 / UCD 57-17) TaxID=436907 RepID=A7TEM8_VANPO|nr:uncharacterized protein Kpol_1036p81 [Vanderwaltozyma polyspora DSM 70294]EDO19335.1 hypothetical protein Kpol_1036p81 [Vanderwaltozyma polyspora DSM 70294]